MRNPKLEQNLLFPNYNVNTWENLSQSVLVYVNKGLGFFLSYPSFFGKLEVSQHFYLQCKNVSVAYYYGNRLHL